MRIGISVVAMGTLSGFDECAVATGRAAHSELMSKAFAGQRYTAWRTLATSCVSLASMFGFGMSTQP
jgi:hypothetical protein